MNKWKKLVLAAGMMVLSTAGCFAYTDDAGIMNKFNYENTEYLYDYLNANDFTFVGKADDNPIDMYMKRDRSMIITLFRKSLSVAPEFEGKMEDIVIYKKGYATDKGIQVGDKLDKVINAYGEVFNGEGTDAAEHYGYVNATPNTGFYLYRKADRFDTIKNISYYIITYPEQGRRSIQFLVNANTKKVLAIGYRNFVGGWGHNHTTISDNIIYKITAQARLKAGRMI